MKFILNKDKLIIEEKDRLNSGSIKYYQIPVEHDEEWNGLTIEGIIIKENAKKGIGVAVINNEIYIDRQMSGKYLIGFRGFVIEDEQKVYQISTKLVKVTFSRGAGEVEIENDEDLPSLSEWEIYIAQIQEMIDESNFVRDEDYVHTDNNFTDTYKNNVDNNTSARHIHSNKSVLDDITAIDITNWNNKAETSDIPDVSNFITKNVNDLTNYELKTNTGATIELSINSSTYVVTLNLKNSAGTILSTGTIDLPLESVVVNGSYDSLNKKVILTLQNGSTIEFSVADLISGLQSEITSLNKLDSDLIDDTNQINKFVTTSEKTTWNSKYDKPVTGIPDTDLSSGVQTSLEKADTALQQHQDISGKLDTSKVKTSNSTTTGDVYDVTYINTMIGNIETLLGGI